MQGEGECFQQLTTGAFKSFSLFTKMSSLKVETHSAINSTVSVNVHKSGDSVREGRAITLLFADVSGEVAIDWPRINKKN